MTDDHGPSQDGTHGEQWTLAGQPELGEIFRLLAIPPVPGYAPAAITAVGVAISPAGDILHYPVHARLLESGPPEPSQVRTAITVLQQWLRAQRRQDPGEGTAWPAAYGGN